MGAIASAIVLALPFIHGPLVQFVISESEETSHVVISKAFMLCGTLLLLALRIVIPFVVVCFRNLRATRDLS